ncbi:MAG TPA: polysaccharide deacetylase family protein [Gaiellaceae bacterium]|nr:polysaccharide deacetylase family protein [Gaiellaceae bacterium]
MIHRRDVEAPLVALTFDDGPSVWTEQILDLLAGSGARATFFVCGAAIEGREATLWRCLAEGHEVANHTHTHPELRELDRAAVFAELDSASAAIESVIGTRPVHFRPPYFESSPDIEFVSRELGLGEPIGADAWTSDWDQDPADQMLAAITATCRAGSIIDLHDAVPPQDRAPTPPTRDESVRTVALLLPWLAERGLASVTVSELLAA